MRLLPKNLVARISVIFFLLGLLLASVQYLLLRGLWGSAELQRKQRMEWDLASELATELQPLLNDRNDSNELRKSLSTFSRINRHIEVYILDKTGAVVESMYHREDRPMTFSGWETKLSLELLESVLAAKLDREFPILGPLPRNPNFSAIFSVARIKVYGKPGYVYVILEAPAYQIIARGLEAKYIAFGGLVTSLVLFASISGLGYLLVLGITRRFTAFRRGVGAIATGELSARVPIRGEDEIAELGEQINSMAEQIELSVERLRENDRWRKEMTAAFSHDLKSPIASLRLHIEQLQRAGESTSDTELSHKLGILQRNVRTIGSYVDNILELSRLESGELQPQIAPFFISEIVEDELIPRFQALADERQVTLSSSIDSALGTVYGDIELISRALSNLIANAIYYNRDGGTVAIEIVESKGTASVTVRDSGVGIAEDRISELLKPFTRGDASRSGNNPGSGLGLAIVKLIVEAHGGELQIDSQLGTGTTIRFEIATEMQTANEQARPLGVSR